MTAIGASADSDQVRIVIDGHVHVLPVHLAVSLARMTLAAAELTAAKPGNGPILGLIREPEAA